MLNLSLKQFTEVRPFELQVLYVIECFLFVCFILEDVEDLPFTPRDVHVRSDKWITDEYDIYEILGR